MSPSGKIPAITGEIDPSSAVRVFPEALSPYRQTVLAYGLSWVATVIGFPFDTVKTRLQSYKKFLLVWDCVAQSYRSDGVRGFYRGVWAPLFLTAFSRSLSVSILTSVKPHVYDLLFGWNDAAHSAMAHPFLMNIPVCFLAGSFTGGVSSLISSPFEFTKVFSQLANLAQAPSANLAKTAAPKTHPLTTWQTVQVICKQHGPLGLYLGFRYQAIRDALGLGVYFSVYETFKWACNALINGTPTELSPILILWAGGMSGVTCWAFIFPLDTAKSLLQKDIVTNTLRKQQGLPELPPKPRVLSWNRRSYRGLSVQMTRSFLVNMVFFGTYEFSMKHFF